MIERASIGVCTAHCIYHDTAQATIEIDLIKGHHRFVHFRVVHVYVGTIHYQLRFTSAPIIQSEDRIISDEGSGLTVQLLPVLELTTRFEMTFVESDSIRQEPVWMIETLYEMDDGWRRRTRVMFREGEVFVSRRFNMKTVVSKLTIGYSVRCHVINFLIGQRDRQNKEDEEDALPHLHPEKWGSGKICLTVSC